MITVRLPVFAALGARPWHNGSTAPSGMSAFLYGCRRTYTSTESTKNISSASQRSTTYA